MVGKLTSSCQVQSTLCASVSVRVSLAPFTGKHLKFHSYNDFLFNPIAVMAPVPIDGQALLFVKKLVALFKCQTNKLSVYYYKKKICLYL